ncbi:ABC transporter permease [Alphaproteobacteria bacterium]|nr:ABC transporter permease [Alphaproteobacteria bacterium]
MQEIIMSIELGLIFSIVAVGIYLTFKTINFADMTCDGSFVLGAAVSSVYIKMGASPFIATFLALVFGGLAGLATGILNVKFKIKDLMCGIIVAFILYSINLRIMNAPNITFIEEVTIFSGRNTLTSVIIIVFVLNLALILILFSVFGLRLRAIGYNKQFAAISGINVKLMTIIGLMLSNAMIALGGSLFSQYQGFCDVSQGFGTLVIGLASVVIGEKMFAFKKEPLIILSCIFGSILYRIFMNIALHSDSIGIKTQDLNLITGLMIIAVMIVKKGGNNALATQ